MTSAVLLQHFLTGLRPEIGRQLLLTNKPANFADALKDAIDIEYALQFLSFIQFITSTMGAGVPHKNSEEIITINTRALG